MPAKAPDINVENAIQAYLAGEAAQVVAPKFGICGKRLTAILKERGIFRSFKDRRSLANSKSGISNHYRLNLPDDEIAKRYIDGESELSLANSFGVSRLAIAMSLRITGTERRTGIEADIFRSKKTPLRERKPVLENIKKVHKMSLEDRINIAKKRQENAKNGIFYNVSDSEKELCNMLISRGINIIPQVAIGPYSIDIGAYPVAVEVWGGAFHFSMDHSERFRYLFDHNWHLIIVYVDSNRDSILTPGAADYIISFLQTPSLNPPSICEYRVIWGNGDVFSAGRLDNNNIARIVPRKYFLSNRA